MQRFDLVRCRGVLEVSWLIPPWSDVPLPQPSPNQERNTHKLSSGTTHARPQHITVHRELTIRPTGIAQNKSALTRSEHKLEPLTRKSHKRDLHQHTRPRNQLRFRERLCSRADLVECRSMTQARVDKFLINLQNALAV